MSFYYNLDKVFSYPFLLAFIIGERGVGKSFSSKKHVLNRFIKNGEQFIYVRRYKTELDTALNNFFDDLQENGYFEEYNLKVVKNKMVTKFLCNNKICGYAVPLSTSNIMKSTAFPDVKTIIYDESMLPIGGSHRYLKNEVNLMLDLVETVFRLRDGQVLFLGNNTGIYGNPYFAYFGLELPYNSEFKTYKDGAILINYIKNMEYRAAKKESKFGKLIEGTDYGRYAIDNQTLDENTNFIGKKPGGSTFFGVLVINKTNIGLWYGNDGYMYMSDKFDPNTLHKFVFDYNDHTEQTIFTSARDNLYLRMCIKCYKIGCLKFENQKIKSNAMMLINKCLSF